MDAAGTGDFIMEERIWLQMREKIFGLIIITAGLFIASQTMQHSLYVTVPAALVALYIIVSIVKRLVKK